MSLASVARDVIVLLLSERLRLTEKGQHMTRKDYNLIADAIRTQVAPHNDSDTVWQVANAISDSLAMDNPRFDSYRFMQACGLNQ